jgi:hypothetical protein
MDPMRRGSEAALGRGSLFLLIGLLYAGTEKKDDAQHVKPLVREADRSATHYSQAQSLRRF